MNGAASPKLWWCFAASAAIYACLLWMGPSYALSVPVAERPILGVVGLYTLAFVIYLFALRQVLRVESTKQLVYWVIGTSIAFRALLLPTPPFQEIDFYRYLWDGAVVAAGIDPYAFPPSQVVDGLDDAVSTDARLSRLVEMARDRPALSEVVREVHFAALPTPYPPVSQAVFAVAAATTPPSWSAFGRLVWLKGWLVLFDVVTVLLVIDLLRTTRMPIGWALAYGWCPLVLKEVAGSGHLDAIATCLATGAMAAGARVLGSTEDIGCRRRWGWLASFLLGLGVGAKLYPVILAPLLAAGLLKRVGWKATLGATAIFLFTVFITLWPMLGGSGDAPPPLEPQALADGVESLPPPPGYEPAAVEKTAGLTAFLNQWEMNDLLFMLVYENVRSQAGVPLERTPWFDVTPESWSQSLEQQNAVAFKLTRVITLIGFGIVALCLAWRSTWCSNQRLDGSSKSIQGWLGAAFLTVAWFWLLAPTQNPWYWCWAVSFLPWARGRAWLAMAAVVMAYYLRFWLETAFPTPGLLGTPYDGEFFFYFVVSWLEFGPILAWLAVEAVLRGRAERSGLASEPTA